MLDNPGDIETVASGLSELLLDLGDFVTGGKRPPLALVALCWSITAAGGIGLRYRLPWLFDHYPGWAVLSAGFWALLTVATVGLTTARIKHGASTSDRGR